MKAPAIVIIMRPEVAPIIRKRFVTDLATRVFSTTESWLALEAIREHVPTVIAIDATFAVTAPGGALVGEIKADPRLAGTDLRVLVEDEAQMPLLLGDRQTSAEAAILACTQPLERWGTRQTIRSRLESSVNLTINGEPGVLIDLSVTGAQIWTTVRLEAEQSVYLTFVDRSTETRCQGVVAWVLAELSHGSLPYRAGLRLVDPESQVLAEFCRKYGTSPYR